MPHWHAQDMNAEIVKMTLEPSHKVSMGCKEVLESKVLWLGKDGEGKLAMAAWPEAGKIVLDRARHLLRHSCILSCF